MPLWSTPAHRPDRSAFWTDTFYYHPVVDLPTATNSTAMISTANAYYADKGGTYIHVETFGTDNWNDTVNGFDSARYFVDTLPNTTTTKTTWTLGDEAIPASASNGTSHWYFSNLREENAVKLSEFAQFLTGNPEYAAGADNDRHAILWAEAQDELSEFWIRRPGSVASVAATFDLTTPVLPNSTGGNPAGVVAAKLPLAPFLFTYTDLQNPEADGTLGHMLGWVAANYKNAHQWPARSGDGQLSDNAGTGTYHFPAGTVLRLKPTAQLSFSLSALSAPLQVLVKTLQKYGVLLYDKNSPLSSPNPNARAVMGVPNDPNWPVNATGGVNGNTGDLGQALGNKLQFSDFEVVDMSGLMVAANSMQVVSNQSPVAGYSVVGIKSAPAPLKFYPINGGSSYDPDGTIVSYTWDFGDGTTETTAASTVVAEDWYLEHLYPEPGSYSTSLTVTDNNGATDTAYQNFYIDNSPRASFTASPAGSVTAPVTVTFDASATTDYDSPSSSFTYKWLFGDGGTSIFSPDATTTNPVITHTYTSTGYYNVYLQVSDGFHLSDVVYRTIPIGSYPPSVQINGSHLEIGYNNTLTLDLSANAYGISALTYLWDFGDGTTSTLANPPAHTWTAGYWTVTVTVTDTNDDTATDTMTVWVFPNQTPNPGFTRTPTVGYPPLEVTFDSTSTDTDGTITTYAWGFGDGASSSGASVVHTYNSFGYYNASLTVTDNDGASATTTRTVWVRNLDPTVSASASVVSGDVPLEVDFTADGADTEGPIVSYEWDFGDGASTTVQNPSHTYTEIGTYTAVVVVTDEDGGIGYDYVEITVTEPANVPPTASFNVDQTGARTGTFDGTGSTDPDGSIASYQWDFGEGALFGDAVVVGDSISAWSESAAQTLGPAGPPWATYPPSNRWHDLLVAHDIVGTVHDGTWPGQNTRDALANPRTPARRSGLFLLFLGANDQVQQDHPFGSTPTPDPSTYVLPTEYGNNLRALLDLYPADLQVLIFPWKWNYSLVDSVLNDTDVGNAARRGQYLAQAQAVADEYGIPLIDLGLTCDAPRHTNPRPGYLSDLLIHSSTFGHGVINYLVEQIVETWATDQNALDTVSHTFGAPGSYTVSLTVTDNDGDTDTATQTFTAIGDNQLPTASATASPSSGAVPLEVTFDAGASDDPDGSIVSYLWEFGDGASAMVGTPTTTHIYTSEGSYNASLTVTDDYPYGSGSASTTVGVTVGPAETPTASFEVDQLTGRVPLTVQFTNLSTDPNDDTLTYYWTFGTGASSGEVDPSYTYTEPGIYVVRLRATNTLFFYDEYFATISVFPPNDPPVPSFTLAPRASFVSREVSFDASASTDDWSITNYGWNFGDGATSSAASATTTHTYTEPDTYTVVFTATDAESASASTTRSVVLRADSDRTNPATNAVRSDLDQLGFSCFVEQLDGVAFPHDLYRADITRFPDFDSKNVGWFTPDTSGEWGEVSVTVSNPGDVPVRLRAHLTDPTFDACNQIQLLDFTFETSTTGTGFGTLHVVKDGYVYAGWTTITKNDATTLSTVATSPGLGWLNYLRAAPDGKLWATGLGQWNLTTIAGVPANAAIRVYDPADLSTVGYTTGFDGRAFDVAFDGNGNAWVTDEGPLLRKVDGTTFEVLDSYDLGGTTGAHVFYEPAADRLYVTVLNGVADYTLVEVDPADGTVLRTSSYSGNFRFVGGDDEALFLRVFETFDVYQGNYSLLQRINLATLELDEDFAAAQIYGTFNAPTVDDFVIDGNALYLSTSANQITTVDKYSGQVLGFGYPEYPAGRNRINSFVADTSGTSPVFYLTSGVQTGTALTQNVLFGPLSRQTFTTGTLSEPTGTWTDSGDATLNNLVPYDTNDGTYFTVDANSSGTVTFTADVPITGGTGDWGVAVVAERLAQLYGLTVDAVVFDAPVVGPQAPVAFLSATPNSGTGPLDVTFNSGGSYDADGVIVTAEWDFDDGTTLTVDPTTALTGITVTLDDGTVVASSTATFPSPVTLGDLNTTNDVQNALLAVYLDFVAQNGTLEFAELSFAASLASGDELVVVTSVASWSNESAIDDLTALRVRHTYPDAGTYVPTVTLTDDDGLTGSASTFVIVGSAPRIRPIAVMTVAVDGTTPPATATIDASLSYDPDGYIVNYNFDFGDGNTLLFNGETVATGYTAVVTSGGLGASATIVYPDPLILNETDNTAVIEALVDFEEQGGTLETSILSITFELASGDQLYLSSPIADWDVGWNFSTLDVRQVLHVYTEYGSYTLRLTVTDNDGLTGSTVAYVSLVPSAGLIPRYEAEGPCPPNLLDVNEFRGEAFSFLRTTGGWSTPSNALVRPSAERQLYDDLHCLEVVVGGTDVVVVSPVCPLGPRWRNRRTRAGVWVFSPNRVTVTSAVTTTSDGATRTESDIHTVYAQRWTWVDVYDPTPTANRGTVTATVEFTIDGLDVGEVAYLTAPVLTSPDLLADNTFTTEVWLRLPEYLRKADALQAGPDYPLLRFIDAAFGLAGQAEFVWDWIRYVPRDDGGTDGPDSVSRLVDPLWCCPQYLPWLARLVGVDLVNPASGFTSWDDLAATAYGSVPQPLEDWEEWETEPDTGALADGDGTAQWGEVEGFNPFPTTLVDYARWQVESKVFGLAGGTVAAIKAAAQQVLTGTKTVRVTPNPDGEGNANGGDRPWLILVETLVEETPDVNVASGASPTVLRAIQPTIPAGFAVVMSPVDSFAVKESTRYGGDAVYGGPWNY